MTGIDVIYGLTFSKILSTIKSESNNFLMSPNN